MRVDEHQNFRLLIAVGGRLNETQMSKVEGLRGCCTNALVCVGLRFVEKAVTSEIWRDKKCPSSLTI